MPTSRDRRHQPRFEAAKSAVGLRTLGGRQSATFVAILEPTEVTNGRFLSASGVTLRRDEVRCVIRQLANPQCCSETRPFTTPLELTGIACKGELGSSPGGGASSAELNYGSIMMVSRIVRIGGKSKSQLRHELELAGVQLNLAGEELFANGAFTTAAESFRVECVEFAVADFGFTTGVTFEALASKTVELGLALCPLEVGSHLRLQYLDQPEGFLGQLPSQHCAPPGSVTIASPPLSDEYETPKGFYLRKIRGELWLRGYWSGPEQLWSPADRLVFCRDENMDQPKKMLLRGRHYSTL